eukprot:TRINITY_DN2440_c0_g1_i2.p1 TRINITY_DN2440_c0_g1~~TRINITY_DN2440_c0_g1_i2.p1  ORF type:complete len:303 (-),score=84.59 TRINITY_DN2440_c0_g1_i2:196-1104(-)
MSSDYDYEAYLSYKRKRDFKLYWFSLLKGSLHFYKDALDVEVGGTIELQKAQFVEGDQKKKKFSFSLKVGDEEHKFAASDDADFKKWVELIKAHIGQEPAPAIPKEKIQKKKEGFAFGMQKKAGTLVASTSVGSAALKKALPEELTGLLDALAHIIAKKSGEAKALEIRRNIQKILMKAYFQIEKKNLTMDDFMPAYKPLREAFDVLVKINDNYSMYKPETLDGLYDKASNLLLTVEKHMEKLLLAHLKPKNMMMMKHTIEYLASPKFLKDVWSDEVLRESDDLFELCLAMTKFNSFHFYNK